MDFFTGIDQHPTVLRGLLCEATTDTIVAATARLGDDEVVAVLTEATEAIKRLEVARSVAAGIHPPPRRFKTAA